MNISYCKIISTKLDEAKKLKTLFDSLYTTPVREDKLSQLIKIKTNIDDILFEVKEKIFAPADKLFLGELEKKEVQEKIKKSLNLFKDTFMQPSKDAYLKMEAIFSDLFTMKTLDIDAYNKFSRALTRDTESAFAKFLEQELPYDLNSKYRQKLLSVLNSVFLNKFLSEKGCLQIYSLAFGLGDNFGCFLQRGSIYVDEAGDGVGNSMSGGFLHARKAGAFVGGSMAGGQLHVEKAGKFLGTAMSGGEIVCNFCAEGAGMLMTGGEISILETTSIAGEAMKGGTLNIQKAKEGAGRRMHGGTINIEDGGDFLGAEMMGGTINAKKADAYVGKEMEGGRINVYGAGSFLGKDMKGGVICVVGMASECGQDATGGTIIAYSAPINFSAASFSGFPVYCKVPTGRDLADTIFMNKFTKRTFFIDINNSPNIFSYEDKKQKYYNGDKKEVDKIQTDQELAAFITAKSGLFVINDLSKISTNPTNGMNGGVLVLRKAPAQNIGEGMENGILVLEDPDLSEAEARRRLFPGRKGGVVMMRVSEGETTPKRFGKFFTKNQKTTLKEIKEDDE